MRLMWRRSIYGAAFAAAAWGMVVAFAPSPLPVEVVRAEIGPMRVTVDEDGEVRAHDRYVVAAPVAGRLMRTPLREGDVVARDQVVTRIAPVPLSERERREQMAQVAAREAQEREARELVHRAETTLQQARRERDRIERLVGNGFVSPQAAEQARTAQETANIELEGARHRAASAAADVVAARAGLVSSVPGVLLDIRSPVAGSVLRIAEPSERVVQAGTPIMTLGDPTRYEVVLDVLSTEAVKVHSGMIVLLENWGGDRVLTAKVRIVEPAAFTKVSALGIEEQRVNVVSDFVDPPGPLGDGYRVEGRIVIWEAPQVLRVPTSSLYRDGDSWLLFIVEAGHAHSTRVEIGQRSSTDAQIVSGLEKGALVVRHPSRELTDGGRVRVR